MSMIHIKRLVVGFGVILFMAVMILLAVAPVFLTLHYDNVLFMLGYLLPVSYCMGVIE
jgi:hypothetical protein